MALAACPRVTPQPPCCHDVAHTWKCPSTSHREPGQGMVPAASQAWFPLSAAPAPGVCPAPGETKERHHLKSQEYDGRHPSCLRRVSRRGWRRSHVESHGTLW